MDLPSFYAASILTFSNQSSPYDLSALTQVLGDQVPRTFPYLYTPPSLLLFYPLSFMTYAQAKVALFALNLLLVGSLAWLLPLRLCKLKPRQNFWAIGLCMGVIILFGPTAQTVYNGQINLVVLTFLLGFWDRSRNGHTLSASVCLAFSIVLKTYPAVLLPILLLSGKSREAVLTILILVIISAASWLTLPESVWSDWIFKVAPSGSYTRTPEGLFPPSTIGNQSINGFFSRLFTDGEWATPIIVRPEIGAQLATISSGLLVLSTILVTFLTRRDANSLDKTMIVTLPCIFLVAPFSWFHHLLYVLPTLLMLLCAHWRGRALGSVLFLSITLCLTLTMAFFRMLDTECVAALALWGLAVFSALSRRVALPGYA